MSLNGTCCLICPYFANSTECGISYHRFPKNNPDKWLKVFDITSDSIATCNIKNARLCSRHFIEDDFIYHGNGSKKHIKKDRLPSIVFIDEKQLSLRKHRLFTGEVVCEPLDIKEKESITRRNILQGNIGKPIWRRSCFLCKRQPESDLSFFMFPKDERKNAWLAACNITSTIPKNAFLCNRHFKKDDFFDNPSRNQRPLLKKTAVPSVFFNKAKIADKNTVLPHKKPKLCTQNVGIAVKSEIEYPDIQVDTAIQRHNTGEVTGSHNGTIETDYDGENKNVADISRHLMNDLSTESVIEFCSVSMEHENASSSKMSISLSGYSALSPNIPAESVLVNDILAPIQQIPITQDEHHKIRYPGDIRLSHIESPWGVKRSFEFLKTVLKQKSRTIYDLKRKLLRRNKSIKKLRAEIANLKKLKVLHTDRADHLS